MTRAPSWRHSSTRQPARPRAGLASESLAEDAAEGRRWLLSASSSSGHAITNGLSTLRRPLIQGYGVSHPSHVRAVATLQQREN